MFGIMTQDGCNVLCKTPSGNYVLKRWDRQGLIVMRKSAFEIDALMQEFMVASNRYDLEVFIFTEEQTMDILAKRLKNY